MIVNPVLLRNFSFQSMGWSMTKYRVEIDDGDGNIDWIEVNAQDDNEAVDSAIKKTADLKPEADPDLMVVITVEPESNA